MATGFLENNLLPQESYMKAELGNIDQGQQTLEQLAGLRSADLERDRQRAQKALLQRTTSEGGWHNSTALARAMEEGVDNPYKKGISDLNADVLGQRYQMRRHAQEINSLLPLMRDQEIWGNIKGVLKGAGDVAGAALGMPGAGDAAFGGGQNFDWSALLKKLGGGGGGGDLTGSDIPAGLVQGQSPTYGQNWDAMNTDPTAMRPPEW